MAKPRGPGISGVAVAMIGTGALAIYAAIKDRSPLDVLREVITGKTPEPFSTTSKGGPFATPVTGGPTGALSGKGKVTSKAGLQPHVAAEAEFVANTWGIEVQGFVFRNIAGTDTLSDHARGLAIDAMLKGTAAQIQNVGNAVFNHYIQNADSKRVKYVIFRHTIWSQERGSHTYAKSDHMKHVHISFYPLGNARAI